jgi:glutaredoxin-related protein
MKNILTITLIIIGIIGLFYIITRPPKIKNSANAQIIFYYGEECPHCHNVLKYISDNQIDQKLKIESKEVYHNTQNQQELSDLSKICPDIADSKGNIGVPVAFIVKENKCLTGDTPIIDKLEELTK